MTVRWGNGYTTSLPLKVFTQINFVADFICMKLKTKNRFLNHSLGDLEVTYAFHLQLVGKPVVDFLFVITELFAIAYG